MANNRFKVGSGRYVCIECGKVTRDTGHGEGDLGMCRRCMQIGEYVNAISDGDMTVEDVPDEFRADVRCETEEHKED